MRWREKFHWATRNASITRRASVEYRLTRRKPHLWRQPNSLTNETTLMSAVRAGLMPGTNAILAASTFSTVKDALRSADWDVDYCPLHESVSLHFSRPHDGPSASNRSETCGQRQLQISKARQTLIGSALVLRPRYLAVLSILAWPSSARTVCKSPVPFKMWRAFVRRNDSTL